MEKEQYEALLDAINNLGAKFDKIDSSFDKVFNEMSIKIEAIPNEISLLVEDKLTSIANSINEIGNFNN